MSRHGESDIPSLFANYKSHDKDFLYEVMLPIKLENCSRMANISKNIYHVRRIKKT